MYTYADSGNIRRYTPIEKRNTDGVNISELDPGFWYRARKAIQAFVKSFPALAAIMYSSLYCTRTGYSTWYMRLPTEPAQYMKKYKGKLMPFIVIEYVAEHAIIDVDMKTMRNGIATLLLTVCTYRL
jgi:hypothetical protein